MSKIAFVFPGQGTQYAGMCKILYEALDSENKILVDEIFSNIGDEKLKEILFNGTDEDLKNTRFAQPAIAMLSVIFTKLLKEKNINPDFTAGHSLGEYSALYASEVLNE